MENSPGAVLAPLIRSLSLRDTIEPSELAALRALPVRLRAYQRDQLIVRDGDEISQSCVLLSGFAGRANYTENGRQLTALHIAGDFVDLHGLLLHQLDHSIVALMPCTVALVQHRALIDITRQHPHLTRLLWLSTLVDAAIHRQHVTSIGRRTPVQRMVHLACEISVRLRCIGLAEDRAFDFPLTQSDLADLFGQSLVHTSRSLRDIRNLPFIRWLKGRIEFVDFAMAAEFAGFDAGYLNLVAKPR